MNTSDQFILLYGNRGLHLLDENLQIIHSITDKLISSVEVLDIAWCIILRDFILITKKNAYIFDPLIAKLSCVEVIRPREEDEKFISCTCSTDALFIATSCSYYPCYIHHYSLPKFAFVQQYSVIDLIGRQLPAECSGSGKTVTKVETDEREICVIRCNGDRIGLIMKIQSECFLYVVQLMTKSSPFSKMLLPSRNCRMIEMPLSGEWLILCDDYRKTILQVSLDCELKTEHESRKSLASDNVKSIAMLGSSRLVIARGKNLEIYPVSQ
jgi:hypothetical protein